MEKKKGSNKGTRKSSKQNLEKFEEEEEEDVKRTRGEIRGGGKGSTGTTRRGSPNRDRGRRRRISVLRGQNDRGIDGRRLQAEKVMKHCLQLMVVTMVFGGRRVKKADTGANTKGSVGIVSFALLSHYEKKGHFFISSILRLCCFISAFFLLLYPLQRKRLERVSLRGIKGKESTISRKKKRRKEKERIKTFLFFFFEK